MMMIVTTNIVLIALFAPYLQMQQDYFVDAAVDRMGRTHWLTAKTVGLVKNGEATVVPLDFDPTRTVSASGSFSLAYHQAITIDNDDSPVILWSGKTTTGHKGTYVSFLNGSPTVALENTVGLAAALSLGPNGDFFVAGASQKYPLDVVHQFTSSGKHVRSFHRPPVPSVEPGRLARSRVVWLGDSVYVLSPALLPIVYRYREGVLVNMYDFSGDSSSRKMLVSMFLAGNRLHVQAMRSGAGTAKSEIHVLENDRFQLHSAHDAMPGAIVGLTPSGQFVERTIGTTIRDTVRLRER